MINWRPRYAGAPDSTFGHADGLGEANKNLPDTSSSPGHWTTLIANVEDLDGNAIRTDPHDRLDLAFLPGDADANRTVDTADFSRIDYVLTATYTPADNTLHDQNRDSSITTADKTREQALLNGTKTTRAWNGYTLPARP